MKKTYTKPELYFESFELSANIATGCGIITKTATQGICGYDQPGIGTLFVKKKQAAHILVQMVIIAYATMYPPAN